MYCRMLKGQRLIENVQLNSGRGTIYVRWLKVDSGLSSVTDIRVIRSTILLNHPEASWFEALWSNTEVPNALHRKNNWDQVNSLIWYVCDLRIPVRFDPKSRLIGSYALPYAILCVIVALGIWIGFVQTSIRPESLSTTPPGLSAYMARYWYLASRHPALASLFLFKRCPRYGEPSSQPHRQSPRKATRWVGPALLELRHRYRAWGRHCSSSSRSCWC